AVRGLLEPRLRPARDRTDRPADTFIFGGGAMIWKRSLQLFLLTITGLAFETSVLGRATLVGTKPELLLLMVVALAMGEGPAFGATAGFVMGLSTDLVLQLPAGVSALTFTLIGSFVGRLRAQFQTRSAWLPMAMVSIATFVG